MLRRFAVFITFALAIAAMAQLPSLGKPDAIKSKTGKPFGTMYFQTKIGSFRIIGSQGYDTKERSLAEGRVEMRFTGTVLINDLKGKVTPLGNVQKEFDKDGRTAYFGSGKLIIEGQFWAIQFFGTDLDARWTGWGMARLYGEFDEKLNTGYYWFDGAPEKRYWSNYGTQFSVPNAVAKENAVIPKERKKGGGG